MFTADYYEHLESDLAEQFKEKPNIDALLLVVAAQMQEVYQFFSDLVAMRIMDAATGSQLDRIGESVGISREEAIAMAEGAGATFDTEDDLYRAYIKYKISLNSSNGSYSDLAASIKAQWDGEYSYSETYTNPATIILNIERFKGNDIAALINTPIAKPAGVGIKFRTIAKTSHTLYIGVSMVQHRSLTFEGVGE